MISDRNLVRLVFVLIFLGVGYYFYNLPYKVETPSSVVTAHFPGKVKIKHIPSVASDGSFGASTVYGVYSTNAAYTLTITEVPFSARKKYGDGVIIQKYFSQLKVDETDTINSISRLAMLGPYNGQSFKLISKTRLLEGKYFLTNSGMVSIAVKIKGKELNTKGVNFLQSLTITQRSAL